MLGVHLGTREMRLSSRPLVAWSRPFHVTYSLLRTLRTDGDDNQALNDIFSDITQVYGWFSDFIGGWLTIVTKNYLNESVEKMKPVKPRIKTHPPNMDDIKLTFFVANRPPGQK